jgi:Zn-dependent protease/CBS domain-containing protein
MRPTLRLGRVFGIEVGLNWSLLFIFALIAWSLAASVLPQQVRDQPKVAYWAAGLVGAIVFFLCLLAHELAHSVVARRLGVGVSDITLWLFGGVSRLEGTPRSARAEALITAVGPATSAVLGGLGFLVAWALGTLGAPPLASDLAFWLGWINVALAVFNLLPAFPLDGGRLLSALLWWVRGSRTRGVVGAARAGRVFAALLIALGLIVLFFQDVLQGVWLAFIGWFLLSAAGAEESQVVTRELLGPVRVAEAMSAPVVVVPDWTTVDAFLSDLAHQHHFSTYPLRDLQGRLSGVVRLRAVLPHARANPPARLRDLATRVDAMPRTTPQETLGDLLDRIGPAIDQRVLVFDGSELVGILSPSDVTRLVALRRATGGRTGSAPAGHV